METFTTAFLALLIFTIVSYFLSTLLFIFERKRSRQRRHVIHVVRIVVAYTATTVSCALAIALPTILLYQLRKVSRPPHALFDDTYVWTSQTQAPIHVLDDGIKPDIGGTGVRTGYFMQVLTLFVAELIAMFHSKKAAVKEIGLSVVLRKALPYSMTSKSGTLN